MWKSTFFVTALLLTSSLAGLTGCKSDTQKEIDHANDIISAHSQVVAEIKAMGSPRPSWSDETLNLFEARIDKLDNLEAQLKASRVVYVYRDNAAAIRDARSQIASLRAARSASNGSNQFSAQKLSDLTLKWQQQGVEIDQLGEPDATWSIEKLRDLLQKLEAHQSTRRDLSAQVNAAPVGAAGSQAISNMKAILEDTGRSNDQKKSRVNALIGQKIGENSAPTSNLGTSAQVMGDETKALDKALVDRGTPDVGWSMDQLNDYMQKCDELTAKLQKQGAFIEQNKGQLTQADLQTKMVENRMKATENRKKMANATRVKKLLDLMSPTAPPKDKI